MAQPQSILNILNTNDNWHSNAASQQNLQDLDPKNPMYPEIIKLRQRYNSAAALMADYSPDMQIPYCRDKEKCFFGSAPSLRLVREAFGEDAVTSWLEVQINNLSEFAGCKDKLTDAQIAETAEMIFDEYPRYKLTEFMLYFQRFKRGEYGRFYGRVDPITIMHFLRTFAEQRATVYNDYYREKERREAEEKRRQEDAEHYALCQRFRQRVPGAFTPSAPITLLQYRIFGYDRLSDAAFADELQAIMSGRKKLPTHVFKMLEMLHPELSNPIPD